MESGLSSTDQRCHIRMFALAGVLGGLVVIAGIAVPELAGSVLRLRPTPSVAVLPFTDLSASHDQEYFADGVAEPILNAMTRVEGLKVIGRTSSFSFKGKSDDLRTIGQKARRWEHLGRQLAERWLADSSHHSVGPPGRR